RLRPAAKDARSTPTNTPTTPWPTSVGAEPITASEPPCTWRPTTRREPREAGREKDDPRQSREAFAPHVHRRLRRRGRWTRTRIQFALPLRSRPAPHPQRRRRAPSLAFRQ